MTGEVTPERVAQARAEIERRRAVAERAGRPVGYATGPSWWDDAGAGDMVSTYGEGDPNADGMHIAACDPSFMLRVHDHHLALLDGWTTHQPAPWITRWAVAPVVDLYAPEPATDD